MHVLTWKFIGQITDTGGLIQNDDDEKQKQRQGYEGGRVTEAGKA